MKRKLTFTAVFAGLISAILIGSSLSATVPGVNSLVSVDSSGVQANSSSSANQISGNGKFVVFATHASNLVPNDTNGFQDVFVRDIDSGTTELISVSSTGVQANQESLHPSISYDGRYVVFMSRANNLSVNDNFGTVPDIYIRDRVNNTTELVSASTSGYGGAQASRPKISANGRFVVFTARSNYLVSSGNTNFKYNIYVRDLLDSTTDRISTDSTTGDNANGDADLASISCDGAVITFSSAATNLSSGDTNGSWDVFIATRASGDRLLNITSAGNGHSYTEDISCDGNYAVFNSDATNLVTGDTNAKSDIFRYNRIDGSTIELVSLSSGSVQANDNTREASISGNGRYIAFSSPATNLVSPDTNNRQDVFVRDMKTGTTELITVDSSGVQANASSSVATISNEGEFVSYSSSATNLVTSDTNGNADIFLSETGF